MEVLQSDPEILSSYAGLNKRTEKSVAKEI
jgi:hypothetical protein